VANAPSPAHRIVVGVDGSSSSMPALDWAIRQAELTHASVLVVMAWQSPAAVGWNAPMPPPYSPNADAESAMQSVLAPIRKEHPDVIIESRIVGGHPSSVLIEASRGADLLVVGAVAMGSSSACCSDL
jgi:nucleotide-binding universal stress UspA family protein